jgi:hypothetical protein
MAGTALFGAAWASRWTTMVPGAVARVRLPAQAGSPASRPGQGRPDRRRAGGSNRIGSGRCGWRGWDRSSSRACLLCHRQVGGDQQPGHPLDPDVWRRWAVGLIPTVALKARASWLPQCGRAPAGLPDCSAASGRARPTTSCPDSVNCRTIWEPPPPSKVTTLATWPQPSSPQPPSPSSTSRSRWTGPTNHEPLSSLIDRVLDEFQNAISSTPGVLSSIE